MAIRPWATSCSSSSNIGFFGFNIAAGCTWLVGDEYDVSFVLGGAYENSGDSYRATQTAALELRRRVAEDWHVGLRFDEILTAYRFNSADPNALLTGQGHVLTWRPGAFVEWSF